VRGHKDLRLLVAAAIACGLLAWLLPVGVLSLLFALPLTLFLPGYAIVAAAFARRSIERSTLLLLGVGVSLAVLALGALLLDYVPGGIRGGSWALLLVLVVIAACRAAALRRSAARPGRRAPIRLRTGAATAAVLALALLAAIAAVTLAFTPLPAKHAIGYTELWIKPFQGSAGGGAKVGIGSDEQNRTAYELRVSFGSGGAPAIRRFALDPGESRVLRVPSDIAPTDRAQGVSAVLFRTDEPSRAYRRVSDWIPPPGSP